MIECSVEQQNIIDTILDNNIIVNAVAGSGKTTVSLALAQQNLDLSILMLTLINV